MQNNSTNKSYYKIQPYFKILYKDLKYYFGSLKIIFSQIISLKLPDIKLAISLPDNLRLIVEKCQDPSGFLSKTSIKTLSINISKKLCTSF